MKSFKSCQNQTILLGDKTVAHGEYIVDGVAIRIKNGCLDDSVDEEGNVIPAVESETGSHIEHWRNGVLHCETGPAIIDQIDGYEEWWLDGKQVTSGFAPMTVCEPAAEYSTGKIKKPVLDLKATQEKIKSLMDSKGITHRQVQAACGFPNVQSVYNWFYKKRMPSLDSLVVLARLLDVKLDDLIVTTDIEI